MKTKSFAVIVSGTAVAALCLLGVRFPQSSNAQTDSASAPAPGDSTASVAPDDSAALPPNIYPSSPLAQVVKLTQSGVSEGVILAYVTNSGSTFNLDTDKIIYLKDIGAPDDLVTAMMQRDQVLQAQMAASAYQPPPPAPANETVAAAPVPDETPVEQPAVVTVDYFYDTLASYGTWISVEGYGRCWRPTVMVVNAGWQPYCDHGHWVWTDDGWYWISDYSWGWAPFHYGRWFHHARFGWCWAPDTVWGPSWVTWRYSGDYCGWAPLPPFAAYVSGIGFTYRGAAVGVDFDFGLGANFFTFVPTKNFCDPHPRRYRVESQDAAQIYSRTTVINNFDVDRRSRDFINHGIDPGRITAVTRTEIHPVAIRETTSPVPRREQLGRDGRTLTVNRPRFNDNAQPSMNRSVSPRPAPVGPEIGSPYQPPNNHENNNPQPRHDQPAPPTPMPGQRQIPPVTTSVSPGHHETPASVERSWSPDNRYAPVTPVQPSAPNYSSTDNRRYPSPKMQQTEQPNPRMNPGNSGGRVGAPATPPSPPVEQPAPVPPQQHNYVSPRNETTPSESRPNYSQPPPAGNQPHSAPPAQSQRSGGNKNQNGQ